MQKNVEAIASLEKSAKTNRSRSDHVVDSIAQFCGNMIFIWIHLLWFALWIGFNLYAMHPFDPYPFQFLTFTVSLEAIFLSSFILISQNRQNKISELRNHLDLQINLLSEQENSKMLSMLHVISKQLGVSEQDPDAAVLEQITKPEELMNQIKKSIDKDPQIDIPSG